MGLKTFRRKSRQQEAKRRRHSLGMGVPYLPMAFHGSPCLLGRPCAGVENIMTQYHDITSETEIEAIAGRTGWVTPGVRDAAGVLSFRHARLPIELIVRSHVGPEKRRDFYVIGFSDPEYVAFFTRDAGWADFGPSMGGGLFRMKGLKLEIFLRDCFVKDYERFLKAPRGALPFDFVHPWQLKF